jgi:hypothetical protein
MYKKAQSLILDPYPLRTIAKVAIQKLGLGTYESRVAIGAVDRPHYGYCVYNAAALARRLGYKRISVLEFGVAGGNGLLSLEHHAQEASRALSIDIDVYGFDTGEGLPEPEDYRDLPYHWKQGHFKMDIPALKARLKRAQLVLGDIRNTSKDFFDKYNPAPIAAVVQDLDFYSSTASALRMFEAGAEHYLPRVYCYFDDTIGSEVELYNEFTGERLAINEFNQSHEQIKLGLPYHLLGRKVVEPWYHQIWICHFFNHDRYNQFVSKDNQALPCA